MALFGTLMVAVRLAVPPLATLMGLAGVSVQVEPESALASHVALMLPAYELKEVSVRLAVPCLPGFRDSACVPLTE